MHRRDTLRWALSRRLNAVLDDVDGDIPKSGSTATAGSATTSDEAVRRALANERQPSISRQRAAATEKRRVDCTDPPGGGGGGAWYWRVRYYANAARAGVNGAMRSDCVAMPGQQQQQQQQQQQRVG